MIESTRKYLEMLDNLVGKPTFAHDVYTQEQISDYVALKQLLSDIDEKRALVVRKMSGEEQVLSGKRTKPATSIR